MSVEKMEMVTVGGTINYLDKFIGECCLDGNVQPERAMSHISESMGFVALIEENKYSDRLSSIEELANNFGVNLEFIENCALDYDDENEDKEFLQKLNNEIHALQGKRIEMNNKIAECEIAIESLSHFCEMDIPLNNIIDCKFIKFRFGHMPKQSLEKLHLLEDNPYLMFFPCSYSGEDAWGVYFAPLDQSEEIDRIFASMYFQRLIIPSSYDTPQKALDGYKQMIEMYRKELEGVQEKILSLWEKEKTNCNIIYSRLVYGSAIHDVRSNVAVYHNSTFCFVGWVPEVEYEEFEKKISQIDGVDVEVDDANKLDSTYEPPTRLKTNSFAKPYEELIEMYGVPNYKEFDPTTFLAIVYTIIFGIMFADLGQGLVLAFIGAVMWFKNKSRMGGILLRCGFSSAVFGTLFGSVFGFEEVLDPFYENVLGMASKPISVMDDVNIILQFSLGIGVCCLVIAMMLNIVSNIKQRKYTTAIVNENGVAGIVTYLSGCAVVLKFLNSKSTKLDWINLKVCFAVIAIGCIVIFFKELFIRKFDEHKSFAPESWGEYIMSSFFEVIEYILSYFSNTMSFLRISAYVLVHAGLMMVVHIMAPTEGVGRIVVIVLGNILVMGVEGVLTYIQVLRLGFYEMFSRFYQGDGKAFVGKQIKKTNK